MVIVLLRVLAGEYNLDVKSYLIGVAGLGSLAGFSVSAAAFIGTEVLATHNEPLVEESAIDERFVCADVFAQDQNDVIAAEYTNATVVDCQFVGCGGVL